MPPRTFADPARVAERLDRLNEPRTAPLTRFVERLRLERGGGESVPWFDPADGGVDAKILVLLEAPGARAVGAGSPRPKSKGSGIISIDNNDASAATCWNIRDEIGAPRELYLHWNICPWYVGDGSRIRPVKSRDIVEAAPALDELLGLLPQLAVVLLAGRPAQRGWSRLKSSTGNELSAIECPHPSPLVVNTTPGAREHIKTAFENAVKRAG